MGLVRKKVVLFVFAVIVIYAIWNGRHLILGPQIDIISPEDGARVTRETLTIKGVIKNGSFISLNGRQIFTDQEGLFSEEILPYHGYNIVEIIIEDRFRKKKVKIIRFHYNNQ